jgi:hypothetical protein
LICLALLAACAIHLGAHSTRAATVYAVNATNVMFSIDVDTQVVTPLPAPGPPSAFSIAPGDLPNTLWVMPPAGAIRRYDVVAHTYNLLTTSFFSTVAFGEGGDGYWYGGGTGGVLARLLPYDSTYPGVVLSGGTQSYAGDIATANDGTTYGLTFDAAGTNYLVSVDTTTGAQTTIGSLPFPAWGLAFTIDGRMIVGSSTGQMYQVNPSDASSTFLFDTLLGGLLDMASERILPEPSSLGLLGMAAVHLKRKRCGIAL